MGALHEGGDEGGKVREVRMAVELTPLKTP
jgi:hypothetical protein